MQFPPTDVILLWPTPNYTNPSEVRGPALILMTYLLAPITSFIVAARCYTRLCISRSFGADNI
jgi:hypothetical protein